MARMVDPSDLEADDLVNRYRRSPADVDAKRQTARQERYDAFVNSIGAASEPPELTYAEPEKGLDNWGAGQIDPAGGDAGLVQARYFRPFAAPVMPPPPSGLRVGPTLDAWGAPPSGASASGFFGNMLKGAVDQADRQAQVARDQRIEWHIAEPGAFEFFEDATHPDRPPITLRQTLAR